MQSETEESQKQTAEYVSWRKNNNNKTKNKQTHTHPHTHTH
jgi:hypothetical protein